MRYPNKAVFPQIWSSVSVEFDFNASPMIFALSSSISLFKITNYYRNMKYVVFNHSKHSKLCDREVFLQHLFNYLEPISKITVICTKTKKK